LNERKSGALSGLGSEVATTKNVREELPKALAQLEVKSLLDIGCGDWNWMRHVKLPCPYIGVDIVASVIKHNIAAFGDCDRTFIVLDAVEESVPDCDAVLVREVLFHLSFGDARKLLSNVLKTRARYLITTTDSTVKRNMEIRTGDFRELNLRIKPFRFPEPLMEISDDSVSLTRRMGVWQLCDLRLNSGMK
jgi:SAM-dependent methyltransferase